MMVNLFEKVLPTAAKAIGWKGALEIAALASIGAEGLNLIVDKGTAFAKSKLDGKLEKKKQELDQKRAYLQEVKDRMAMAVVNEETQEEEKAPVEQKKPEKKASNKKK